MRNNLFKTLLLLIVTTLSVQAGNILGTNNGEPVKWTPNQPIQWVNDGGGLGILDNAGAITFTEESQLPWTTVDGAGISFERTGQVLDSNGQPVDIVTVEDLNDVAQNTSQTYVAWDEDGSLFTSLFGPSSGVLGFAGPTGVDSVTGYVNRGRALINGAAMSDQAAADYIKGVIAHEFGHFLGLGHTLVNAENYLNGLSVMGQQAQRHHVSLMYPFALEGQTAAVTRDDISSLLQLYAADPDALPHIHGTIHAADGTEINGINVVLRNVNDPFGDSVGTISGQFPNGSAGAFRATALTEGAQYVVSVGQIYQGGYSQAIRTDYYGAGSSIAGRFPGVEEYYNGANESDDPITDNPMEFTPVDVNTEDIAITFNRSPFNHKFQAYFPSFSEQDGNTSDLVLTNIGSTAAALQITAFAGDGTIAEVSTVNSLDAGQTVSWNIGALFAEPANVGWISVGSDRPIDALAVLRAQDGSQMTTYAPSNFVQDALRVPHIAQDTATFQTRVSVVNPSFNNLLYIHGSFAPSGNYSLLINNAPYTQLNINYDALVANGFELPTWANLFAGSGYPGAAGIEVFSLRDDRQAMAALELNADRGTTMWFLHTDDSAGAWNGIAFQNPYNSTMDVVVRGYTVDGVQTGDTLNLNLGAGEKVLDLVHHLWERNGSAAPNNLSHVSVTASAPISGYQVFGMNSNSMDALQSAKVGARALVFPAIAHDQDRHTMIGIVNPNPTPVSITAVAYDGVGAQMATKDVTLPAYAREFGDITAWFGELNGAVASVRVSGDQPIVGYEAWGARDGSTLAAALGIDINDVLVEEANTTVATAFDISDRRVVYGQGGADETGSIILNLGQGTTDDLEDIFRFSLERESNVSLSLLPDDWTQDYDIYLWTEGSSYDVNSALGVGFGSIGDTARSRETINITLPAGNYIFGVSAFDGAATPFTGYTLTYNRQTAPLSVDAGEDVSVVIGDSAQLSATASGGVGTYTYLWSPADTLSDDNASSVTATPEVTTTYTITVTDELGNTASDSVTVTVVPLNQQTLFEETFSGEAVGSTGAYGGLSDSGKLQADNEGFQIITFADHTENTLVWAGSAHTVFSFTNGIIPFPGDTEENHFSVGWWGDNGTKNHSAAVTPIISLPQGASSVAYRISFGFPGDANGTDRIWVTTDTDLSDGLDPSSVTELKAWGSGAIRALPNSQDPGIPFTSWVNENFDLSQFAGQDIRIGFEIESSFGESMHIDDIVVTSGE